MPPPAAGSRAGAGRLLEWATSLAQWLVDPLLRFNLIDRSLALGAQAFGAVIPLMIVLQAVQPGSSTVATGLIDRFGLTGEAAETVEEAFAVTAGENTTTALSVFVLIVSVLSFTRRLQRLYEETWELTPRGFRGSGWGLAWIAFFATYISLHPALDQIVAHRYGVVLSIAGGFTVALMTPYLLLGRRLPARRLLRQAALTAIGSAALGVWSAIYMPRAIEDSASAYGAIGVAFAMLTWLWGLGIVLVVAAVYGSPQMRSFGSPAPGEGTAAGPG